MQMQIKQVQQTSNFDNHFISYNTKCYCGMNELDLTIEMDNEIEICTIYFQSKHIPYYSENYSYKNKHPVKNFLIELKERIKCSLKILLGEPIEFQEEFIFRNKSHINDLILALQEGSKYVENNFKNSEYKK